MRTTCELSSNALAALIVLNLSLFGYLTWSYSRSAPPAVEVAPYGYQSSQLITTTRSLTPLADNNWSHLILIFAGNATIERHADKLAFLSDFADSLTSPSVRFAWVRPRGASSPSTWTKKIEEIPDRDDSLHRDFKVVPGHSHGALLVVDKTGRVDFRVPSIPQPDIIRQVVEKYAFGTISYDASTRAVAEFLPLGSKFPTVELQHVLRGDRVGTEGLLGQYDRIVLLTAACQECQFHQNLRRITALYTTTRRTPKSGRIVVLVDRGFNVSAVRHEIQAGRFPPDSYITSLRDLFGVSTNTRVPALEEPVVVTLNKAQRVRTLATLQEE
jgi:hypothetical protein